VCPSWFAGLEQWEQEVKLYVALKQLRLFKQHKLWKAFKCWKSAIHSSKLSDAKSVLNKQLFLLSPVFQKLLQQFHALCHELSGMRLHSIQQGQVGACNWGRGLILVWLASAPPHAEQDSFSGGCDCSLLSFGRRVLHRRCTV
jgi:hypothetical protein